MEFNALLDELKVDAILVTDGYNLRYFSKFRGGEGTLVITRNTRTLIVDSRYTEAAKEESDFSFSNNSEKKYCLISFSSTRLSICSIY